MLGQIVTLALPSVVAAAQSGNLSVGGIVSQVIAGGAGGAILTAIIAWAVWFSSHQLADQVIE